MASPQRGTKAGNVSIAADLLEAGRGHDINLSATLEAVLERQLSKRRRDEWLTANGDSIQAYKRHAEEQGTFGDTLRSV